MYDDFYKEWVLAKNNKKGNDKFNSKIIDYRSDLQKLVSTKQGVLKRIILEKIDNLNFILQCINNICTPITNQKFESEITETNETTTLGVQKDKIERIEKVVTKIENSEEPKYLIIRLLESIPTIVGSDLVTYGPFNPEDIAAIPIKNAQILIKRGVAIEVGWGNKNENG